MHIVQVNRLKVCEARIVSYVLYHHHAAIVLKVVSCVKAALMSTEHLFSDSPEMQDTSSSCEVYVMFQNSDEVSQKHISLLQDWHRNVFRLVFRWSIMTCLINFSLALK
jgi:hypothetical protein